jgi:germination protein M
MLAPSSKRLLLLLAAMLVLYLLLTSNAVYTACVGAANAVKGFLGLKKPSPAQPPAATETPAPPTSISYRPAEDTRAKGTSRLTLYFADQDFMFLVPVTRTVELTRTPIKASLLELIRGPAEGSGLISPFSEMAIRDLALRADGTLRIDVPAQVVQASAGWGSSGAVMALEAILKTVAQFDAVSAVQFMVEGKIVPELFHGLAAAEPIVAPKPTSQPGRLTLYYALYAGSRAYLVPEQVEVAAGDTVTLLRQAVEGLKQGKTVGDYRLYPTLPANVTVLGVDLTGRTAIVNLSGEFTEVFAQDPARQALQLDSLVYTVTSFPEVEQVQLLIEGQPVAQTLGSRNVGQPLKRPAWPNPE